MSTTTTPTADDTFRQPGKLTRAVVGQRYYALPRRVETADDPRRDLHAAAAASRLAGFETASRTIYAATRLRAGVAARARAKS